MHTHAGRMTSSCVGVGEHNSFDDHDGAGGAGAVMGETVVFVNVVILEIVRMVLEVVLVTIVLATGKTKVMRKAAPVLTLCLFCSCLVTPSSLACA